MKRSVLIIEDEKKIRNIIKDYFTNAGYRVFEGCDGEEGLEVFEDNKIDLVILDIMMPKIDGWSVCRRLRKQSDVPIIILTARGDDEDILLGFELKADEYVIKPFNPQILLARANALLDRVRGNVMKDGNIIIKDDIVVDLLSREIKVYGEYLKTTPKEFDMLVYLMENENRVLSREKILDEIWGYDYFGDIRVVDNHIRKLRRVLKEKSYVIVTVFGVGYKFEGNR